MRAICPIAVAVLALVSANTSNGQVAITRTIPRIYAHVPPAGENLRRRIRDILAREVRLRSEYEDFIADVMALGRSAVPEIIRLAGGSTSDRYVTEALLRMGGPDVRHWVEGIFAADDPHVRQALLAGVPAVVHIDGSLRSQLPRLLHDTSPQVRILAIEKLHTLAPATDLLTRCRDINREVARAAILTVSRRWVFLDHGDRELKNLARFVGILEMHRRDERWNVGDGFLLSFHKERITDTRLGQELRQRSRRLPWFVGAGETLSSKRLAKVRAELGRRTANRDEFLAKTLKGMAPAAGAELLLVLADASDAEIRLAACTAGLTLLDPELAISFVRFLKDPAPGVRAQAKELLEQTGFYLDQRRRWARPTRR